MRRHYLSKSKFVIGLQCLRRLWWTVHERDAPELKPDAALQAVFDRGHLVGDVARGSVPGGVLIELGPGRIAGAIAATKRAIDDGAPVIYEASFSAGGVFVAVDILERSGPRWNLVEVKSTARVKDAHVPDAAVQAHVLQLAGLQLQHVEIMHLDTRCRFPDLSNLFARSDVTARVQEILPTVPAQIETQVACLAGPLPEVEPGDHCHEPYACPFEGRCWPAQPPDQIDELYSLSKKNRDALLQEGYASIHDLPDDAGLAVIADRQRRAVQAGKAIVEPGLARALQKLAPPIAYLDFETVMPAIPVWHGCRPFEQVVVQFSVHREDADGGVQHRDWLATGGQDPQGESVVQLLAATEGAEPVAVYNASFERSRILELAKRFPDHAEALHALAARLVDVLPIVRNHLYHPDFRGSFSLKKVVPALVPHLSYDTLTIADGNAAATALEQLLLHPDTIAADQRERLRTDLLTYCAQDTRALLELVRALRGVVG